MKINFYNFDDYKSFDPTIATINEPFLTLLGYPDNVLSIDIYDIKDNEHYKYELQKYISLINRRTDTHDLNYLNKMKEIYDILKEDIKEEDKQNKINLIILEN